MTSAAHCGHAEEHRPAEHHRQPHGQDERRVGPPAALQLVDPTPAPHAVHVLDGGAEELLEQDGEGQEAEGGAHAEAPLPGQAGGGGEEAHAAEAQAQYEGHRGAVAQQGLAWLSEPPKLHLIFQDASLYQSGVQVEARGVTDDVAGLVKGLHLGHGSHSSARPRPDGHLVEACRIRVEDQNSTLQQLLYHNCANFCENIYSLGVRWVSCAAVRPSAPHHTASVKASQYKILQLFGLVVSIL